MHSQTVDNIRLNASRHRAIGVSVIFAIAGIAAIFSLPVIFGVGAAAAHGQEPQYPLAIAVAPSGDVFIADRTLPGIWKLKENVLSLYFKADKRFRTPLNAVRCLAIDKDGRLLAGDSATREVYRFDDMGKPTPLTGKGIGIPMGLAVDAAGDILVSDLELHQIYKIPAMGGAAAPFAQVSAPSGLFLDADNNLWVTSRGNQALQRVSPEGKVEAVLSNRAFEMPHNIVLDADKTAYIADGYAKAIWKLPAGQKPEKWVQGDPLQNPVGLAWRGETLLVVDPKAKAIFQIDKAGAISKLDWVVKP